MTVYVVGASCRALAASLQRGGEAVEAFDLYSDRDLNSFAKTTQLRALSDVLSTDIRELPAGSILLAGGCENNLSVIAELAATKHTFLAPSVELIRQLRNVEKIAESFAACSPSVRLAFDFPDTRNDEISSEILSTQSTSVSDLGPFNTKPRWLIKHRCSSGGIRVHWLDSEMGRSIARDSTSCSNGWYLQQHIDGDSYGVLMGCFADSTKLLAATESIVCNGEELLYGKSPFLYRGSRLNRSAKEIFDEATRNVIECWVYDYIAEHHYRGLLSMDVIVDQNCKVWLLEFNPRWTAGMECIELAYQTSLAKYWKEVCRNPNLKPELPRTRFYDVEKRIHYAGNSTIIDERSSDKWFESRLPIDFEEISAIVDSGVDREAARFWCDIPAAHSTFEIGEPIITSIKLRRVFGEGTV